MATRNVQAGGPDGGQRFDGRGRSRLARRPITAVGLSGLRSRLDQFPKRPHAGPTHLPYLSSLVWKPIRCWGRGDPASAGQELAPENRAAVFRTRHAW